MGEMGDALTIVASHLAMSVEPCFEAAQALFKLQATGKLYNVASSSSAAASRYEEVKRQELLFKKQIPLLASALEHHSYGGYGKHLDLLTTLPHRLATAPLLCEVGFRMGCEFTATRLVHKELLVKCASILRDALRWQRDLVWKEIGALLAVHGVSPELLTAVLNEPRRHRIPVLEAAMQEVMTPHGPPVEAAIVQRLAEAACTPCAYMCGPMQQDVWGGFAVRAANVGVLEIACASSHAYADPAMKAAFDEALPVSRPRAPPEVLQQVLTMLKKYVLCLTPSTMKHLAILSVHTECLDLLRALVSKTRDRTAVAESLQAALDVALDGSSYDVLHHLNGLVCMQGRAVHALLRKDSLTRLEAELLKAGLEEAVWETEGEPTGTASAIASAMLRELGW